MRIRRKNDFRLFVQETVFIVPRGKAHALVPFLIIRHDRVKFLRRPVFLVHALCWPFAPRRLEEEAPPLVPLPIRLSMPSFPPRSRFNRLLTFSILPSKKGRQALGLASRKMMTEKLSAARSA